MDNYTTDMAVKEIISLWVSAITGNQFWKDLNVKRPIGGTWTRCLFASKNTILLQETLAFELLAFATAYVMKKHKSERKLPVFDNLPSDNYFAWQVLQQIILHDGYLVIGCNKNNVKQVFCSALDEYFSKGVNPVVLADRIEEKVGIDSQKAMNCAMTIFTAVFNYCNYVSSYELKQYIKGE